MIVPEKAVIENLELLALDEITKSEGGDCLFLLVCSQKVEEQTWGKYAAIYNLFSFPKFGKC